MAHQEIVKKLKYFANCFMEVMTTSKSIFDTIKKLEEFYQIQLPGGNKVIILFSVTYEIMQTEQYSIT